MTANGDEETFVTLERAAEVAAIVAARSRRLVDLVSELTEATVYVAVP